MPVLAGSLVGSNGVFLRALYAAGIKGYYDGLAVHFYTLTLASLRSIHEVQLANGDTKPLWLDEFGWSSCCPRHRTQQEQACVTAQIQATNLTNTFRSLARTPYVAAEVALQAAGLPRKNFGVLSASGARKPAFAALARVLASPFGPISPVTLSLRRHGSRVAGERVGAGRGLHGAGSLPGQRAALQGPVHARPLQPLLDRAAARCSAPAACGCASTSTGRGRGKAAAARHLSITRRCGTARANVSARIFRSRPSDQWAM